MSDNLVAAFVRLALYISITVVCDFHSPGDGRILAQEARNQTAEFRFRWGYEMPPDVLAQWIADRAQICTQYVSKRPSGVVAMILGIDGEKGTPQLFTCDPAGYFFGLTASSAGHRDREAVNFLEKKMRNNPSLSFQETVQVGVFFIICECM